MTNAERFALCSEPREQDQRSLILFAMVWLGSAEELREGGSARAGFGYLARGLFT